MGISVDLSGINNEEYEVMPAGSYTCKITEGTMTETGPKSKAPGTPMIKWVFTVQNGQYANRRFFLNTVLAANTMFKLKELLQATGRFDSNQLSGPLDFDIEQVIGSDVSTLVKITPATEEWAAQNQIKKVRPVSAEEVAESSLLP